MTDMTGKSYSSFEEIDQALEILTLEKQLGRIKLARSASRTLESLSPGNLAIDSLGALGGYLRSSGTLQKFVVMLIARNFFRKT